MSKKTLTIIIIVFVVIILGMLVASFFVFRGPSDGSGETGGLRDFFPFGKGENADDARPPLFGGGDGGRVKDGASSGDTALGRPTLALKQLTTEPVAGAAATSSLQREVVVRYIERTTGNVYEIGIINSNQKRLSNTTIPAVREAFFDGGGLFVNLRYLNENDVIKTFAARILAPGETIEKEEDAIEKNEGGGLILLIQSRQWETKQPFNKLRI